MKRTIGAVAVGFGLALAPPLQADDELKLWRQYMDRGYEALRTGELESAETLFVSAQSISPPDSSRAVSAAIGRAIVSMRQGDALKGRVSIRVRPGQKSIAFSDFLQAAMAQQTIGTGASDSEEVEQFLQRARASDPGWDDVPLDAAGWTPTPPEVTNSEPPVPDARPAQTAEADDVPGLFEITGSLNLRSGPSTNSQRIGGLEEGDLIEVVERDGSWLSIRVLAEEGRGETGWVYGNYARQLSPPDGAAFGIVKTTSVNVRHSPEQGGEAFAWPVTHDVVQVLAKSSSDKDDTWYHVKIFRIRNGEHMGKLGWVHASALRIVPPDAAIGTVAEVPARSASVGNPTSLPATVPSASGRASDAAVEATSGNHTGSGQISSRGASGDEPAQQAEHDRGAILDCERYFALDAFDEIEPLMAKATTYALEPGQEVRGQMSPRRANGEEEAQFLTECADGGRTFYLIQVETSNDGLPEGIYVTRNPEMTTRRVPNDSWLTGHDR